MEENKKSKLGLGILIGVLITLVIGLSAYVIYDKVLSKDNDNNDSQQVEENKNTETEEETNETNNNNNSNENEVTSSDFDISKFDNTKEAINGPSGRAYNLYTNDESNTGLSINLNNTKKSATITIDWSKYGNIYGTSSWMNVENKYEVTNFTKSIKDVYIGGFGQASGYETAFYIMEDGTVEYTPIMNSLGNNGSSSDTVIKSYGKIENVSGVVKILTGIDYCEGCVGEGLNILGVRADGTFYNLSAILYETDYYNNF